jgi:hypothetical protein
LGFVLGCYTQGDAFRDLYWVATPRATPFGSALGYYAKPFQGVLFYLITDQHIFDF